MPRRPTGWTPIAALALLSAFGAVDALADPRGGAPIVFAHRDAAPASAAATPAPVTVRARPSEPAPVRYAAPARRADADADAPDQLYGYGARRDASAAPAIDLRGTLSTVAQNDALSDDAFDASPEVVEAAPARSAMLQPAAAIVEDRRAETPRAPAQRPAWLEQERTGAPYEAMGRWYVPTAEPNYAETGQASWYGADFQGRRTASGEAFDSEALTAAHPTLPIPSLVQITNLENGREVIVRVNDRGPFHADRLIDVSRRTAEVLGFEQQGSARVHVRYLGPAPRRVGADGADLPSTPVPAVTAAPRPAAAPAAAPRRADGAYIVQVGAFSNPANVERARARLSDLGVVSVDARPTASGATVQRVRLGAWNTRAEAETARAQAATMGYAGAVVAAR